MKEKWENRLLALEEERVEQEKEWRKWIDKKDRFMEQLSRRDLSVTEGKIEVIREVLEDL